jgi:ABC-type transporter Mla subunit MlaD
MRIALGFVAVVAVAAVIVLLGSHSNPTYRAAAEFDTAKGLVAGNAVKIAGTPVGKVTDVELTSKFAARVSFQVERRFAPFHRDAKCTILSQGLISEYYVQCSPGATRAPELAQRDGRPTVPLVATSAPVGLQDVLNIFSRPTTTDRLRMLVNELGIGLAGRGHDVNSILLRSNPALTQATRALKIVGDQRRELGAAIDQTDKVLASLARGKRGRRACGARADATARTTAAHSAGLSDGIHDLPAMLSRLGTGSRALARASRETTPVLGDLRRAAPQLNRLTVELPRLTRLGTPALDELSSAAAQGRRIVPAARPVARELNALGAHEKAVEDADKLGVNLQQVGGIENLLNLAYGIAGAGSAYDSVSHYLSLFISVSARCIADQKAPGCSRKYSAPGAGAIPFNDPSARPVVDNVRVPSAGAASVSARAAKAEDHLSNQQISGLLEYLLK